MARSMSSKLLCLVAQDTYVNKEVTKNIFTFAEPIKTFATLNYGPINTKWSCSSLKKIVFVLMCKYTYALFLINRIDLI